MAPDLVKSNVAAWWWNTKTATDPPTSIRAKEGLRMQPTEHEECWRPIPGNEKSYWVSNKGRVLSIGRTVRRKDGTLTTVKECFRKPAVMSSGHLQLVLDPDSRGKPVGWLVHRMVMAAFVGPCPEGMEVRHLNGDPADNRLENLRYGTRQENVHDMLRHGTSWQQSITHCPRGHEYVEWNTMIYRANTNRPGRVCRVCTRAKGTKAYKQNKALLQEISDRYFARDAAKYGYQMEETE